MTFTRVMSVWCYCYDLCDPSTSSSHWFLVPQRSPNWSIMQPFNLFHWQTKWIRLISNCITWIEIILSHSENFLVCPSFENSLFCYYLFAAYMHDIKLTKNVQILGVFSLSLALVYKRFLERWEIASGRSAIKTSPPGLVSISNILLSLDKYVYIGFHTAKSTILCIMSKEKACWQLLNSPFRLTAHIYCSLVLRGFFSF